MQHSPSQYFKLKNIHKALAKIVNCTRGFRLEQQLTRWFSVLTKLGGFHTVVRRDFSSVPVFLILRSHAFGGVLALPEVIFEVPQHREGV